MATRLLERLQSEVELRDRLVNIPAYKMPPPEEETAELNKKQLAAFLEEYWKDDIGHIKETTTDEGGHPYPLPPGFMKEGDDEAWNQSSLKSLVNTPDGYIWVPSRSLVNLRSATKRLDIALVSATNKQGFAPLRKEAKDRLQQIENDVQQLELKDECDMTTLEAAAIKASKKLRKEVKASLKAAAKGKGKKAAEAKVE